MKNVLKVLKSRLFLFSLLGCFLFCRGIHLYTRWSLARFEASLPSAPQSTSYTIAAREAKPPSLQEQIGTEMGLLSEEEKATQEDARRRYYDALGLEPPPPGYRYIRRGDGAPELVKYKDPIISIAWGEGYGNYHQLTDNELARYSCLLAIDDPLVIKRYGLSPEEVSLGLAWKQELYEKTKGPRPTIHAVVSRRKSDPQTPEEERALLTRMRDLEHDLFPRPPDSFRIDYDVFDQIIPEIRTTQQRR